MMPGPLLNGMPGFGDYRTGRRDRDMRKGGLFRFRLAIDSRVLSVLLVCGLAAPQARGQGVVGPQRTSTLGPTGNARPYNPNRVVSALQNPVTMNQFRTYQGRPAVSRPQAFFGVGASILAPGELPYSGYYLDNTTPLGSFGIGTAGASGRNAMGIVTNPVSPLAHSPMYYGGFGQHRGTKVPATLDMALRRRPSIIAASSLTAPVRRAMNQFGGSLPPAFMVQNAVTRQPRTLDAEEPAASLSSRISGRIDLMRSETTGEAWARFEAQEYRRAIRLFQSAVILNPEDLESRVGELFCYLATGRYRTAIAALHGLARRTPNPFTLDLNLRDGHGSGDRRRFGLAHPGTPCPWDNTISGGMTSGGGVPRAGLKPAPTSTETRQGATRVRPIVRLRGIGYTLTTIVRRMRSARSLE